ncbi:MULTISPECIES: hypothetical protein [Sphingobacterium]|uniref:Uncharacterized protein n=1 Tax=Sphingobacterium tenebrionis TaxID=3111775 RepID=A0ABU8I1N5_9SPHI|nr:MULTISPECIES: hypothetical protein [unclassified Sphingobacterium]QBR13659.1 hypothetical protein E3D81_16315 [Sphingobacterium sp. CZ-2]
MSDNPTRNSFRRKSPTQRFLSILGLAMFLFYFVLGLLIIFWKGFPIEINPAFKNIFGVLLIVYSFMRFARLWQNNFRD